ncbi:MAG TPA: hypothetical protein ENN18_07500 [Proteobacteria bacterium]|nr:hypothetical protein [Pseudomonadota bacterium]
MKKKILKQRASAVERYFAGEDPGRRIQISTAMTDDAGHGIARSDSFKVAIERCRDHYFYERCPERCHLTLIMPPFVKGKKDR